MSDRTQKSLEKIGGWLIKKYRTELKRNSNVATTKLYNSLDFKVIDNEVSLIALEYAQAISGGSKPSSKGAGKVSKEFFNRIYKWAKAKHLRPIKMPRNKKGQFKKVNEFTFNRMVSNIAVSIQKSGLLSEFGGNKGNAFIELGMISLRDKIGDELAKSFGDDISDIFRKQIETLKT